MFNNFKLLLLPSFANNLTHVRNIRLHLLRECVQHEQLPDMTMVAMMIAIGKRYQNSNESSMIQALISILLRWI